jgi:hypothetical protein
MTGIIADNLMWRIHFLSPVSKTKLKINLRRLIVKNVFAEAVGMVVNPPKVFFTKVFPLHYYSDFVIHGMRKGETILYVLFSVF